MSEADSPSNRSDGIALPAYVRATGRIRARFAAHGARTRVAEVYESGGYRLRFPRAGEACEAVIVNTGGGVVGGDDVEIALEAGAGAHVVATTTAAEKIYRSDGATARVKVELDAGPGARLDWLPQETILFDGASLVRRLDVSLAADARVTLLESVVFGRGAMGESCGAGLFHDRWRVRRDGRLVFAEEMRFDGRIDSLLDRLALGGGARAAATLVHIAPDAEARLEALRGALPERACEAAASAWDGLLAARFVSPSPEALRAAIVASVVALRGAELPRLWRS
ncbi:MAG: urease accessory protein UreD [Rhizobiales bacterium]|nr:urease accessory protein UreD [Hyphomicrobiales bacterium]